MPSTTTRNSAVVTNRVKNVPRNGTWNQNSASAMQKPGIEKSEPEIGQKLAQHHLHRRDRRGDQKLHRAAFPFARDGERGELCPDQGQDHRDQPGNDEILAVEIFVEPDPGLHHQGRDAAGAALRGRCVEAARGRNSRSTTAWA